MGKQLTTCELLEAYPEAEALVEEIGKLRDQLEQANKVCKGGSVRGGRGGMGDEARDIGKHPIKPDYTDAEYEAAIARRFVGDAEHDVDSAPAIHRVDDGAWVETQTFISDAEVERFKTEGG